MTNQGKKRDASKNSFYRSKQPWERGKGAPKKGNPRYMPVFITDKNGNRKKVYKVRPRKKKIFNIF